MRAVIQRVDNAKLTVEEKTVSKIDKGLVVYLGINQNDTIKNANNLAKKIADLRIFRDENCKLNLSVKNIGGQILVVSNFTIYADCSRGNRPNFMYAMKSENANVLYEFFVTELKSQGIEVKTGMFGEHMTIEQTNNGPINIIVEI